MERKLAHNLMTANTKLGREYRDHLMNGLPEEQINYILGLDSPKVEFNRQEYALVFALEFIVKIGGVESLSLFNQCLKEKLEAREKGEV